MAKIKVLNLKQIEHKNIAKANIYGKFKLKAGRKYSSKSVGYIFMIMCFIILITVSSRAQAQILAPQFSHDAGFYSEDFDLIITSQEGTKIFYTIDGSKPTNESLEYLSPIHITNITGNPNVVSMVNTTSPNFEAPIGLVQKANIIRAIAISQNESSKITTATYFLDGTYSMPVVSITANDEVFFDYYTGIYTMGVYWDNATNWGGTNIFHPANYQNSGGDWEREVHMEIFWYNQSRVVNQDIGIRISGEGSRVRPQKSFKLYAKKGYGASTIPFPLFEEQNFDSYARLSLRNSDDDERASYIRDMLAHSLMQNSGLDMEPYVSGVLFINGEYWGYYPLRDRASQYYLADRYDIDKDEVIILENNAEIDEGVEGDEESYVALVDFVRTNDLNNETNYDYVKTQMDTENYAKYFAINTFVGNTDWADRNLVYWRLRMDGTNLSAPIGQDGLWRWIMHDNDWSFGYRPGTSAQTNMFDFIESKTWGSFLWRGLVENEEFRDYFITYSADALMTNYSTENVISKIDELEAEVAPEIQRQIDRWRDIENVSAWETNLEKLRQFARDRPNAHREDIVEYFGLGGEVEVTVNIQGQGDVKVNSVVPSSYPWIGSYFQDVPIALEAIPSDGWQFVGWMGAMSGSELENRIVLTENSEITAVFAQEINNETLDGADIWFTRKYPATYLDVFNEDNKILEVEIANPQLLETTISWKIDGAEIQNSSQNSSLIFNLPDLSGGLHIVEVIISTQDTTITQMWQITINEGEFTCYNNINELPATCTNGEIISDISVGCRIVTCASDNGSITGLACNKPSDDNPSYFEFYRTQSSGIIPTLCLGESCLGLNGYSHDFLPQCTSTLGNETGGNETGGNETGNETLTCYSQVSNISATCDGGLITQDIFGASCRTITCTNNEDFMQIKACEKPDIGTKQYFEMYKSGELGSSVNEICIGDTCIANNGFALSTNYPICILANENETEGNETGNETQGNETGGNETLMNYTLSIYSEPIGDVIINGTVFGLTPQFIELPSGNYVLNVSADGYLSNVTNIVLNENLTLNLILFEINSTGNESGGNQTGGNETGNETTELVVDLISAPWYPQGNNQVWICSTLGGSGEFVYDYYFGDNSKLLGYSENNVFHTYANGTYETLCIVHDLVAGTKINASENITIG